MKQVCSQLESSFGRTGVRVGKVSFEREKCDSQEGRRGRHYLRTD